ncbi:transcriptional repressor LexA [Lactobacillus sp. LC28-10]|uniref:LexA repressor n=1 Tax=Secundilactobacillus angelensis TaxID=2722706 RepID=A0ABX1KUJ6_9LACO|nr:transcriptional repressor LexA [Secundilactobacillus angelensis]MCH5461197.1 transcriptional repressor LexA [Secundilactobacillus angelensis]NLR17607.1 transcriptional repressor LexA [Secundilactobacillus angelensis]
MTKSSDSKQLAILRFIYNQTQSHGYPPTVREIGEKVGLSSTSTVHGHIARLAKKGLLIKDPTKPRALEVTELGVEALGIVNTPTKIPVLGTVAAGEPILAVQEATDYFPIPDELMDEASDLFMLQIRGESMINAGILNGDKVIVKKQHSAENGQIVIAMTEENEATCKRFYKEDHYYRLQPENDTMDPIILNQVTVLGKVVGLYRDEIF